MLKWADIHNCFEIALQLKENNKERQRRLMKSNDERKE